MKTIKLVLLTVALVGIVGIGMWFVQDSADLDRQLTAEVLQIEKDIKHGAYPDREQIDRLYRYRNGIDEKYGFGAPSKEFCEAYDRVIKPL